MTISTNPQKYMLTAGNPAGNSYANGELSFSDALKRAALLNQMGYQWILIHPEYETPIPDSLLVPCAQPVAEGAA